MATKKTSAKPRAAKRSRYVYYFGDGKADGAGSMKPLLGGKGANLHEMTRIGLPVPPGFTLTTEVCTYFYENKRSYPPELERQVALALAKIEKSVSKKLGDAESPLLVSVRSGARDSMPGMMDTILNLGMNDAVVEIVAAKSKNAWFAWDSLPPLSPDVRRRRHGRAEARGRRSRAVRNRDRGREARARESRRTPISRSMISRRSCSNSKR